MPRTASGGSGIERLKIMPSKQIKAHPNNVCLYDVFLLVPNRGLGFPPTHKNRAVFLTFVQNSVGIIFTHNALLITSFRSNIVVYFRNNNKGCVRTFSDIAG